MSATEYEKELKKFISSEDNLYGVEFQKIDKDDIILTIVESIFIIHVIGPGSFKLSSDDDVLEVFCSKVNNYCKQGKKKITDVLLNATGLISFLKNRRIYKYHG